MLSLTEDMSQCCDIALASTLSSQLCVSAELTRQDMALQLGSLGHFPSLLGLGLRQAV